MEGTCRLRLLGPVQVERDGEPVRGFESRKALALLGYLAVHAGPIPREQLVDLLWGDKPEARGRANLSWVLNRISSLLPGCVEADRHTVGFQQGSPYWLDTDAFEELETQGEPASLVAVVELYRGEFLEGLYLQGCPEFEIWLVGERERWRQRVAQVLEKLVTRHSRPGQIERGLGYARHLLVLEPWREETHRQVMRLLAWSDQRGAALAQYETCRRILAEELGVEPAVETTRLYEQIRDGELEIPSGPPDRFPDLPVQPPSFLLDEEEPGERPVFVARHNLPAQDTPFVGREVELTELARLLGDPDVRLLTILGAGGMGKTRLALEAGAAELNNFEHGVYFVPLAPLQSVEAIVPTTAEALGFSFYEGGQPRQQLLDYLRHKRLLLIMDNFEHLLACPEPGRGDGVGLVSDVLKAAPEVKILTTSRVRLNVGGEHRFQIVGMEIPDWETLEEPVLSLPKGAAEYSAIKLFLQSARRARPGFELGADNLKHVGRICRLVGGMPLGIRLAAAWVGVLTPAEIATEIGQSLDFLETDLHDVPERQRSMSAVFDHSYRLLTEREREVFQGLSVFRGGFTRDAAQEVTGASLRELRVLVDKSLLGRDPAGRYGIHELLRGYAAEKLGEVPAEEEAARDRHCTYYARFLQQREAQLVGRGQKQALADIRAEIENVRAAWNWAVAQGKIDEMDRCLDSLAEFYRIRAWSQEGEETFARAAQRLAEVQGESGNHKSKIVLGKVLLQQGRFCHFLGLAEKASELLQRSLAMFRDLGARREVAYVLYYLGDLVDQRGGEGKPLHQEALAISREIGDRRGIALSLRGLGDVATGQGEYEAAKQLLQESLALFRELDNQQGIAQSLINLGYVAFVLGEYMLAKQLHQESLMLSREVGDQRGIADALVELAQDVAGLEEYGQAKRIWQESLALYKEIGHLWGIETVVADLGEIANFLGEYAEAIQLAQECLTICRKTDSRSGIAWALRILGDAACGLGDFPGAKRYHRQALEVVTGIGQTFYIPLHLVGIAALLAGEGEKERALELLALVLHHPISWQWAKDQAAPLIAELEAELSPDAVAAARERGRARDLEATVVELLAELEG